MRKTTLPLIAATVRTMLLTLAAIVAINFTCHAGDTSKVIASDHAPHAKEDAGVGPGPVRRRGPGEFRWGW